MVCRLQHGSGISDTTSSYMQSSTLTQSQYQSEQPSTGSAGRRPNKNQSTINFSDKRTMMETPNELLNRFKEIVKLRGVKGLIRLQKILK